MLESIESPEDVKALPPEKLDELCAQLRQYLIMSVSKTGGHLASNLGVVELTVAIHRVFDTSKDRIVFDVGHQSYVHKLLTGRKERFATLRQFGGLSGFPKPSESIHDAFIAGHASTSVSAALGIARARTLTGGDYKVIAFIGDGALTGGLAFEGLSDAGESNEPMIIILNDNGMAINDSVGGIARYLSRQRMRPSYSAFKKGYRKLLARLPGGKAIYRFTHRVKTAIKEALLHCSMFEDMGLQYTGPIDGHNIKRLVEALEWAGRAEEPVVVHVITQKGKGYDFSERSPKEYHGVSPFDYREGVASDDSMTFSTVFGDEIVRMAEQDGRICAITASMSDGTGLEKFAGRFPERFFDVGIAEGHAVTMAAGMASGGAVPVFAVYSTFLQRSYDMLIHDAAIGGLHVVFAVDRAGLVRGDGETHHGLFDVAFLSSVPGMTIYSPSSYAELRDMLRSAVFKDKGPVAVRYPRGAEGVYAEGGSYASKVLRAGSDVTLVTYGSCVDAALEAAGRLEPEGVSVEIVKLGRICPLELDEVESSVRRTGRLLVLEECAENGSVGERVASALAGLAENITLLNTGSKFIPCGDVEDLRRYCGIDAAGVRSAIREQMGLATKAPYRAG
ncbi:MAG: 1-deoxy-D-xylulose-5-phosphate synthase [Oscillospiraceae bacterium]|nr:1-deoxy-D-xylulose-5-phosphate synthase [Oscillospiraceae bacterium]